MTPLDRLLRELIAGEGPITVERYMALALGHPLHGYYPTRDPLGAAGDFTTAPEISQMFGELLGLWCAAAWTAMGRPSPVRVVELGPGRGTLMADAVRAAGALPGFRDALDIHLVETSPALRRVQERTLGRAGVSATWHDAPDAVPDGPALLLANEFFDALPVRQLVRTERGWHERLVGLGPDGRLAFGLAPEPDGRMPPGMGRPGDVREIGEAGLAVMSGLAGRLVRGGGAALVVDYGHARTAPGDTLQAVRRHAFADPLADPGAQDLTAHVDFAALARVAALAGAAVQGPVGQGEFLRTLGIEARAARLARNPGAGPAVAAALSRLAGAGDGEMGALFKVLALRHPALAPLPGLPAPAA